MKKKNRCFKLLVDTMCTCACVHMHPGMTQRLVQGLLGAETCVQAGSGCFHLEAAKLS